MEEDPQVSNNQIRREENVLHVANLEEYIDTIPMTNITLPNQWVLYLYDKALCKKMTNRPNFQAKSHREICTISTVNDLMYVIHLMESKLEDKPGSTKINLDANDYIFMRRGIEPLWEDVKNANGGTFTIKMDHEKGYHTWLTFMLYMMGETMTYDMNSINGLTISYISDSFGSKYINSTANNVSSYTYIKIWDADPNRDVDKFFAILPNVLKAQIKDESLQYSSHKKKKHFGHENIVKTINDPRSNRRGGSQNRGGFSNYKRR